MAIDDLKRWHWCVVGILAGCAVAGAMLWAGPGEPRDSKHIAPTAFENQVIRRLDHATGRAVAGIEKVAIHPADKLPLRGGMAETEYVSYVALLVKKDKPGLADPVPHYLVMQHQNARDRSLLGDISKMDVREYLAKLNEYIGKLDKTRYPKVEPIAYKFRWLDTPKGAFAVYPAGGLIVIGLIWPTIVNFLVGAGFGRGRRAKAEYDLSRFKGGKPEPQRAKPVVTDADMDQLARLEAELEAKLKAGAEDDDVPAASPAPAAPTPVVPVLNAGPAPVVKEAPKAPEKPKGFGADQGDYYPTEVHGKPKQ